MIEAVNIGDNNLVLPLSIILCEVGIGVYLAVKNRHIGRFLKIFMMTTALGGSFGFLALNDEAWGTVYMVAILVLAGVIQQLLGIPALIHEYNAWRSSKIG